MRTASVVLYAGLLLVVLFTPFFDAAYDRWWLSVGCVLIATLAVGAAVVRWWVLTIALVVAVAVAIRFGADGIFLVAIGTPFLGAVMGVGCLIGRILGPPSAIALFVLAGALMAWAGAAWLQRGDHVSSELQAALPTDESLNQLCREAQTPPDDAQRLRAEAETLIRAVRRDPRALVTYTFYYEDAPTEKRDITLRQLAGEQADGAFCMPRTLRDRLRAVSR